MTLTYILLTLPSLLIIVGIIINYFQHLKLNTKIMGLTEEIALLTTEVEEGTTVIESAITLIKGFKAQLDAAIANGATPEALEKLKALSAKLDANEKALATAVAENTTPAEE